MTCTLVPHWSLIGQISDWLLQIIKPTKALCHIYKSLSSPPSLLPFLLPPCSFSFWQEFSARYTGERLQASVVCYRFICFNENLYFRLPDHYQTLLAKAENTTRILVFTVYAVVLKTGRRMFNRRASRYVFGKRFVGQWFLLNIYLCLLFIMVQNNFLNRCVSASMDYFW